MENFGFVLRKFGFKLRKFIIIITHGIDTAFVIKSYLIAIFAYFILQSMNALNNPLDFYSNGWIMFLNILLYPFTAVLWNDIVAGLFGRSTYIIPLPLMFFIYVWKLFKILILLMFSVFIAPLGMLYVWFVNRNMFN